MKFEPFIARRYLFSGQHKALVSAITVISIVGVAVGVFALIVVLAVMEGFDANLVNKVIGAYAHLEIVPSNLSSPAIDTEAALKTIRAIPEVKAAGPVIMRQALVQVVDANGGQPRQTGLFIEGVDLQEEPKITKLMDKVYPREAAKPAINEIVVGKKVATKMLYVRPGDKMRIITPTSVETANGRTFKVGNAFVAGYFETGFPEMDMMFGYMSLEAARELFLVPEGQVDGLHVVLHDAQKVKEVCAKLQNLLGNGVVVSTWQQKNPMLFDAIQLEKWAMFIILLLIVLVAAFNIIGTLIMVVMEKTREIGIMKSMGASEGAIMRIFLLQGTIVGLIGTTLGAAGGLFVCYLLEYHIKLDIMSDVYLSDRIPILMNPWMNTLIVFSSLLICVLASVYPARQAAKLDPVEALRYE